MFIMQLYKYIHMNTSDLSDTFFGLGGQNFSGRSTAVKDSTVDLCGQVNANRFR